MVDIGVDRMYFGEKLKMLREERKLTQDDLARKLNLSKANISRYELGSRQPSIDIIITIAEFFNVSLDWLLGRSIIKEFSTVNSTPRNFNNYDLEILEYIKSTPHVYEMFKDLAKAPELRVKILTRIWHEINTNL